SAPPDASDGSAALELNDRPASSLSAESKIKNQKSKIDTARLARERAESELAELQSRIAPLENEINQLTRQFWVTKEKVVTEKYDLSASRYRQIEHEEVFYEKPTITLQRMRRLEHAAGK